MGTCTYMSEYTYTSDNKDSLIRTVSEVPFDLTLLKTRKPL